MLTPMDGLARWDLFLEDARRDTQDVKMHGAPLPLAWVVVLDNIIPDYAVPFSEAYGGPQFIARAFLEGQYYIGRAGTGLPFGALISYGARQLTVKRYEVLCFATEMRWGFGAHGSVQQSSVILSSSPSHASYPTYDSLKTQDVIPSLLDSDFMRVITDDRMSETLPAQRKPPSPLTPLSRRAIEEMCSSATHETETTQTTLVTSPITSLRREDSTANGSLNIKSTSSALHEHRCSETCGCGHVAIGRKRCPSSPLRPFANADPEKVQIGQRVRRLSANASSHSIFRASLVASQGRSSFAEQDSQASQHAQSHGRSRSLSTMSPLRLASLQRSGAISEEQSDGRGSPTVTSPRTTSCLSPITHFTIPEPFNEATDSVPTLRSPKMSGGFVEQVTRRSYHESERAAYSGTRSTHAKASSTVKVSSPLASRRPLPGINTPTAGYHRSSLHFGSMEEDSYASESSRADQFIVPLSIAAGAHHLLDATSTQHRVQQESVGSRLRPAPHLEDYQDSRNVLTSRSGTSHPIVGSRLHDSGSPHGPAHSTMPTITPLLVGQGVVGRSSEHTTQVQMDASSQERKTRHARALSQLVPLSPVRTRPSRPSSPWSIKQRATRVEESVDDRDSFPAMHDTHSAVEDVDFTKTQLIIDASVRRPVPSQSSSESSASSASSRRSTNSSLYASPPSVPLIIVSPSFDTPSLPESPREPHTTFEFNDHHGRDVVGAEPPRREGTSSIAPSIAIATAATAAATIGLSRLSHADNTQRNTSPRSRAVDDEDHDMVGDRHSANTTKIKQTSKDHYISHQQQPLMEPPVGRTWPMMQTAPGRGEHVVESTGERRYEDDVYDSRVSETLGRMRPSSPVGPHSPVRPYVAKPSVASYDAEGNGRFGATTQDTHVDEIEKTVAQSSHDDITRGAQGSHAHSVSEDANALPRYTPVESRRPSMSSRSSSSDDDFEDMAMHKVVTSAKAKDQTTLDTATRISNSSSESWVDGRLSDVDEKKPVARQPVPPVLSDPLLIDKSQREDIESSRQHPHKVEAVNVSQTPPAQYPRDQIYSSRMKDADNRLQRSESDEFHFDELHVNPVWDVSQNSGASNPKQKYQVPVSKYLRPETNPDRRRPLTTRESEKDQRTENVANINNQNTTPIVKKVDESARDSEVKKGSTDKVHSRTSSPKQKGSGLVSTLLAAACVAAVVYDAVSDSQHKEKDSVQKAVEHDERDNVGPGESAAVPQEIQPLIIRKEEHVVEHAQQRDLSVDSVDVSKSSTRTSAEVVLADDTRADSASSAATGRIPQVATREQHEDADRAHDISAVSAMDIETSVCNSQSIDTSLVSARASTVDASMSESSVVGDKTEANSEQIAVRIEKTPEPSTFTTTTRSSSERTSSDSDLCEHASLDVEDQSSGKHESLSQQGLVCNERQVSQVYDKGSSPNRIEQSGPASTETLPEPTIILQPLQVSSNVQQTLVVAAVTKNETKASCPEIEQRSQTETAVKRSDFDSNSPISKAQSIESPHLSPASGHRELVLTSESCNLHEPPLSPSNRIADSPASCVVEPTLGSTLPANEMAAATGQSSSMPVPHIEQHTVIINNTHVSIHNEQSLVIQAEATCDEVSSVTKTESRDEHCTNLKGSERTFGEHRPDVQSTKEVHISPTRTTSSTQMISVSESSQAPADSRCSGQSDDTTIVREQSSAMSDIRDCAVAAATTGITVGAMMPEQRTTSATQPVDSVVRCQTRNFSEIHNTSTSTREGTACSEGQSVTECVALASSVVTEGLQSDTETATHNVHVIDVGFPASDHSDVPLSVPKPNEPTGVNATSATQLESSEACAVEEVSTMSNVKIIRKPPGSKREEQRTGSMRAMEENSELRISAQALDCMSEDQTHADLRPHRQSDPGLAGVDPKGTVVTPVLQEQHVVDIASNSLSVDTDETSEMLTTTTGQMASSLLETKSTRPSNDGAWTTDMTSVKTTDTRSRSSSHSDCVSRSSIHVEELPEVDSTLPRELPEEIISRTSSTRSIELPNPFQFHGNFLMTDVQEYTQSPSEMTPNSTHELHDEHLEHVPLMMPGAYKEGYSIGDSTTHSPRLLSSPQERKSVVDMRIATIAEDDTSARGSVLMNTSLVPPARALDRIPDFPEQRDSDVSNSEKARVTETRQVTQQGVYASDGRMSTHLDISSREFAGFSTASSENSEYSLPTTSISDKMVYTSEGAIALGVVTPLGTNFEGCSADLPRVRGECRETFGPIGVASDGDHRSEKSVNALDRCPDSPRHDILSTTTVGGLPGSSQKTTETLDMHPSSIAKAAITELPTRTEDNPSALIDDVAARSTSQSATLHHTQVCLSTKETTLGFTSSEQVTTSSKNDQHDECTESGSVRPLDQVVVEHRMDQPYNTPRSLVVDSQKCSTSTAGDSYKRIDIQTLDEVDHTAAVGSSLTATQTVQTSLAECQERNIGLTDPALGGAEKTETGITFECAGAGLTLGMSTDGPARQDVSSTGTAGQQLNTERQESSLSRIDASVGGDSALVLFGRTDREEPEIDPTEGRRIREHDGNAPPGIICGSLETQDSPPPYPGLDADLTIESGSAAEQKKSTKETSVLSESADRQSFPPEKLGAKTGQAREDIDDNDIRYSSHPSLSLPAPTSAHISAPEVCEGAAWAADRNIALNSDIAPSRASIETAFDVSSSQVSEERKRTVSVHLRSEMVEEQHEQLRTTKASFGVRESDEHPQDNHDSIPDFIHSSDSDKLDEQFELEHTCHHESETAGALRQRFGAWNRYYRENGVAENATQLVVYSNAATCEDGAASASNTTAPEISSDMASSPSRSISTYTAMPISQSSEVTRRYGTQKTIEYSAAEDEQCEATPHVDATVLAQGMPLSISAAPCVADDASNKSIYSSYQAQDARPSHDISTDSQEGCLFRASITDQRNECSQEEGSINEPQPISAEEKSYEASGVNTRCGVDTEHQSSDSDISVGQNSIAATIQATSTQHEQSEGSIEMVARQSSSTFESIEADGSEGRLACSDFVGQTSQVNGNRHKDIENTMHHIAGEPLPEFSARPRSSSTECTKEVLNDSDNVNRHQNIHCENDFSSSSLKDDRHTYSLKPHAAKSKGVAALESVGSGSAISRDLVTIFANNTSVWRSSVSEDLPREGVCTQESSGSNARRRRSDGDCWEVGGRLVNVIPSTGSVYAKGEENDAPRSASERSTVSSRSPVSPPGQARDSQPLIRHPDETCHPPLLSKSIPSALAALSHDDSCKHDEHTRLQEHYSARSEMEFSSSMQHSIRNFRVIHRGVTSRRSSSIVSAASGPLAQKAAPWSSSLRVRKRAMSLPGTSVEWATLTSRTDGTSRCDRHTWSHVPFSPKPLGTTVEVHYRVTTVEREAEERRESSITNLRSSKSHTGTLDVPGKNLLVDTEANTNPVTEPSKDECWANQPGLTAETTVGESEVSLMCTVLPSETPESTDSSFDLEYRALASLFEAIEPQTDSSVLASPEKEIGVIFDGAPNTPSRPPSFSTSLVLRTPEHNCGTSSSAYDARRSLAHSEAVDEVREASSPKELSAASVTIDSETSESTDLIVNQRAIAAPSVSAESVIDSTNLSLHEKVANEIIDEVSNNLPNSAPIFSAPETHTGAPAMSSSAEEDDISQEKHSECLVSFSSASIETTNLSSSKSIGDVVSEPSIPESAGHPEDDVLLLDSTVTNNSASPRSAAASIDGVCPPDSEVSSRDELSSDVDGGTVSAVHAVGISTVTKNEQCSEVPVTPLVNHGELPGVDPTDLRTPPKVAERHLSPIDQGHSGVDELNVEVDESCQGTTMQQIFEHHDHSVEYEQELHGDVKVHEVGEIGSLEDCAGESASFLHATTSQWVVHTPNGLATTVPDGPIAISLLRSDAKIKIDMKPATPELSSTELSLVEDEDESAWVTQLIDYQHYILQNLPLDTEYRPIVVLIVGGLSSVDQVVASAIDQISHLHPNVGDEFLFICVLPGKDEENMAALEMIVLGIEHELRVDGIDIDALPAEELEFGYLIPVMVQELSPIEEDVVEGEEGSGEEDSMAVEEAVEEEEEEEEEELAAVEEPVEAEAIEKDDRTVEGLEKGGEEEHATREPESELHIDSQTTVLSLEKI